MEAYFGPFGQCANLDAREEHGLRRTYHWLRNRFGRSPWNPLGDVGHLDSRFFPFGDFVSVDAR